MQFSLGFDGKTTRIGDLIMIVNKETIARESGLCLEGIKWFKNKGINKQGSVQFLKLGYIEVDWTKGIPRSWIKDEWSSPLFILHKYLM